MIKIPSKDSFMHVCRCPLIWLSSGVKYLMFVHILHGHPLYPPTGHELQCVQKGPSEYKAGVHLV